jgi:hypothetical protein
MVEYISDKAVILPQAKHFFKSVNKKDEEAVATYIYYYYAEDSIYINLLPTERDEVVISVMLKLYPKFNIDEYRGFITKYEHTILTPAKRLALSLTKRIEKIITVLEESEIAIDDLEKEGKNMKALSEIFKLQDVLAEKLAKESGTQKGKGSKGVNVNEVTVFDNV